jgi:hypothetical protein
MRLFGRSVAILGLLAGLAGCASFRLQGCRKLAACGALAAYVCEADLVCADAEGRTIRSEPDLGGGVPCHVCSAGTP